MSEEDLTKLLVRVDIPDLKTQKCVVLSVKDTVWAAKQVVLDKLSQDLPHNILNYGLYLLPSVPGKLGKYMDDGRFVGDYVLHGHVPRIELRYKKRDYSIQVSLKGKDISKANAKANLRKFVENVAQGNVKKIEKMLDSGVDPNFITEDGNTPLGMACGRNSNIQVIMPLLSNGAHIDFRGKEGLTPLHRAALGGNSAAIKILLSYGASPNYRDLKGLTPLYHTTIMGDDTACCETLLRYRGELGIRDHAGWTELHQVAKYGHASHTDLLVKYGADLHAQNNAGNTPLHVAASHGQGQLAVLLMKRGSDRTSINFSSQLPSQVAILCGHHSLSAEISNFQPSQVEPVAGEPDYHPGARQFDRNLFDMERTRQEVGPAVPPPDTIIDSLAQEWSDKDYLEPGREEMGEGGRGRTGSESMWSRSAHGSSVSIPSMTGGLVPQPHHSIETADSESLSSYDRDSIHSTSTTGGTPGPNTPQTHHRRQQATFAMQRERLYRAGPGRYVAVEDVEPQQSDDIPLRRGMEVEVVFIGKGGYWEGRVGGRLGWFPARAIQEMTDDGDSGVFSEYSRGNHTMASLPEHQILPPPPPMQHPAPAGDSSWLGVGGGRRDDEGEFGRREMAAGGSGVAAHTTQQFLQPSTEGLREVLMKCGPKGYGFAMRGVKATKAMRFTPTPQVPALQYIGSVEKGGSADIAGLSTGDFLLEINHHNVTYSTHDDVVNIIRQSGKSLHMKVVTPYMDTTLRTSMQLQQQVEIMSSTNSLDRQRSNGSTPRMNSLRVPYTATTAQTSTAAGPRETMIDDLPVSQQQQRGGESPNLERLNKSGWDSSQDEATNTPTTPSRVQKFSYLHPVGGALPPATQHYSPKKQKVPPPVYQGSSTSLSSTSESVKSIPQSTPPLSKSATLPPNRTAYAPAPADSSEEEEEESAFMKALKSGKEKLVNSPSIRKRSNTLPPNTRNLAAQRGRLANRGAAEAPVTGIRSSQPSTEKTGPTFKQPLVAALMRRVPIENKQVSKSSDEDDSFSKTPPARSKSQIGRNEKVAPPAPKPKPQIRRAHTVDPRHHDAQFEDTSLQQSEPQGGVSSPGYEEQHREANSDEEGGSGRMNWKSVLRPVKRTESGRASPGPVEAQRSRSNSQNQSSTTHSTGEPVANNFTHFAMESDHLPPPLPANTINNRLSMEFLDLPPPEDFMLLPGAETGETSTYLTNSPSLQRRSSRPSSGRADRTSSPPPPPPPDSSPPRELFDHSPLVGVKFPPLTKQAALATQDDASFKVPSPIPSPKNGGSFETEGMEPEAILPPNEFIPETRTQGNVGFRIPTRPGFEIPTPPCEEVTVSSKESAPQDLDEAIRQLQLLSEDLTTPHTTTSSKGSSPQNKRWQDLGSGSKQETVTTTSAPQPLTVSDDAPQAVRSRSSTSSSNVSSLNRDQEMEPPFASEPTKTQTHVSVPPTCGMTKPVMEWEVEDVCQWLEEIGLGEHCPQFHENEILGEHLLELTKEELTELGVKKIGHKKTFLTKAKELVPSQ